MAERSVLVRLMANVDGFKRAMREAADSTEQVGKKTTAAAKAQNEAWASYEKNVRAGTPFAERLVKSAQENREAWDTAGTALTVFGTVTVAALGATVKAAMDWESAWAGVTKTLPDDADFAATEAGLRDLAKTLPATHSEIAAVAEAAGQLGVAADAIVPFTKTMIDLGETTNLSADEAATSIAQMMNVMKTAPEDVGRLGAALVELGNNGASTEADIMNMVSYLTGSAALIGASESDVLALANTMTSLGINAERGGGVMTRTMQDIYTAVANGGDQLDGFAKAAGMSGAEFARAFEDDPIRAIGAFTDGLAAAKGRGENIVGILNELGIKGTQDTAVLLQMAGAQGMLNDNLDMGAEAWANNTALVDEANKRYDTTEAKLAIAKNNIVDAAIEIGEAFLPVVADIAEKVAAVAGWFGELPDPIQAVAGQLGAVAGVGALAAGAFLLIFPRAIETYKAFQTLNTTMPGVAGGLGKIAKAAGIAGVVWAAASALDGLVQSMGPAPATMEETTAALLAMGDSTGDIDAQFAALGGRFLDIDNLNDAMRRLIDPSVREGVGDFVGKVVSLGNREGNDDRDKLVDQFNRIGESLGMMVTSGSADLAAQQFEMLREQWEAGGGNVEDLRELLPGYTEALQAAENEQEIAAQSAKNLAGNTGAVGGAVSQTAADMGAAYESLGAYAAALGLDEDATEALVKKTEELGTSLADFINPLGTYTTMLDEKAAAEEEAARKAAEAAGASTDSWRDFVKDTGFSFDEYMQRLRDQVLAQENWQTNMLRLAGRVSQGTLDELARMGPEGAPLVADLVNRSDAELDEFDDITARRSKEATDAWGVQLTLATPVLAAVGRVAGQGVVEELAAKLQAGAITVADIARQYGINLAGGINPVLGALGRPPIMPPTGKNQPNRNTTGFFAADGALVDYYANGGLLPAIGDQSPQIQANKGPGGIMWAETGAGPWEAFISGHPGKRDRSLDIWRETGRRLGADEAQYFADGGFVRTANISWAERDRLLAAGWRGRRGDGMEALYAPAGMVMAEDGSMVPASFYGDEIGGWSPPLPPSTAPFQAPISTGADATMQHAYTETMAWLERQAAAAAERAAAAAAAAGPSGPVGGGALGGTWQSIFNAVKAAIPQARQNSTYRPGDPGYHGRNKAVDFGFGSGPGGAGSAGLASINRFLHDRFGGSLAELIYAE